MRSLLNIHQSLHKQISITSIMLLCLLVLTVIVGFIPQLKSIQSISGYASLHNILEIISIIISLLIFIICWNNHTKERPGNFLLLGLVFFGVAVFDLLHAMSFPGMPNLITENTPQKTIDFWLAARFLTALGLLALALLPWRALPFDKFRWRGLLLIFTIVMMVSWVIIYKPEWTPPTYIKGQGLTLFKIVAEYTFIALYLAAALLFLHSMRKSQPYDIVGLFAAVCLMAMSELYFTLYSNVNDVFALLGHAYKILAYGFLYKSIFSDNINIPYQQLNTAISALKKSEERFAISQQFSNVGTFEWDIKSNNSVWSDQLWSIIGLNKGSTESSFETYMSAVHPDDKKPLTDSVMNSVETGTEVDIEYRLIWPDGSIHWVRGRGNVERDDAGQPTRMLGVIIDIDSSKEVEEQQQKLSEQLQQSQKMESIGQLTGGIAHDFNNLLSAIIGFADLSLIKYGQDPNSKLSQYQRQILQAGERGRDLVSKMLAFGRASPGDLQPVDGEINIKEVAKLLRATMPASLTINIGVVKDVPQLLADPTQLHQVIANLIINAHHATGEYGRIGINLLPLRYIDDVCASCHQPFTGKYIEINVTDDGCGISNKDLEHIFEPFFTSKEVGQGSGMGLPMVDGILHQANGHILVESEQKKGSRFRLLFKPADIPNKQQASDDTRHQASNVIHKSIMIVDDEESITSLLTETLGAKGYSTHAFNSSVQALDAFKSDPAAYDLVITDQSMPELTGSELSRIILQQQPDFPIILCTGYSATVDEKTTLDIGIAAYLKKPVKTADLLKTILKVSN